MAKRVSVDRWLFVAALLLVLLGLVMVFSASAVMAKDRFGSPYTFVLKQVGWAFAGVLAMLALMRFDYRRYKHPSVVFTLLGVTMVMLVAVFFLDRSHNTHRWIRLGMLSFQPSELAKPALILFLAYFLETRTKDIGDWRRTLLPAALPSVVLSLLIVLQPDLGTAMVCMALTASVLFVAGMELKYLGYGVLASLPMLYYLLFHVGFRRQRMLAFLDPWADPQKAGFHMVQSLIAVGTGGITGIGLMEGKQKLFYLPEPHTDFIFAVIAEELTSRDYRRGNSFCDRLLPRHQSGISHIRPLRTLPGYWNHQHYRHSSILQHQRGAGIAPDQRNSFAADLLRWYFVIHDAGLHRRAAEY